MHLAQMMRTRLKGSISKALNESSMQETYFDENGQPRFKDPYGIRTSEYLEAAKKYEIQQLKKRIAFLEEEAKKGETK